MAFLAAIFEFQVRAVHLSSVDNRLADSLSRFDSSQQHRDHFFELAKGFVLEECVVSPCLYDFENSW